MTRKHFVAGNWKLHKTVPEATSLASALRGKLSAARDVEVAVAPVFTALAAVKEALGGSNIALAAQNVYWEPQGAFTGEVSAPLLKDVGCAYCIVGHSERRQYFGETDDSVNRRTKALLASEIAPIVCVGETLAQREAGKTVDVVLGQLEGGLAGIEPAEAETVVIAYEPVWAIGTGRTASPSDAQDVHGRIREKLSALWGELAERTRILYGGSVKPDNARELMAEADIDGALVGGASLSAESFVAIIEAAS